jgi:hypothetical protein
MDNNKITFIYEIFPNYNKNGIYFISNAQSRLLYFLEEWEIIDLLSLLSDDKLYMASPELINSVKYYYDGQPVRTLSEPFVITKTTDPVIIVDHLLHQVNLASSMYKVEDFNNPDHSMGIALKYSEINIFYNF